MTTIKEELNKKLGFKEGFSTALVAVACAWAVVSCSGPSTASNNGALAAQTVAHQVERASSTERPASALNAANERAERQVARDREAGELAEKLARETKPIERADDNVTVEIVKADAMKYNREHAFYTAEYMIACPWGNVTSNHGLDMRQDFLIATSKAMTFTDKSEFMSNGFGCIVIKPGTAVNGSRMQSPYNEFWHITNPDDGFDSAGYVVHNVHFAAKPNVQQVRPSVSF